MADDKEGLTDPLSIRTTDTGSMKRMSAENNQARKTIKLKPLSPKKESAVSPSDLTSVSEAAEVPQQSGDGSAATVAMDRGEVTGGSSINVQAGEATVAQTPPSSSGVPGVKQTIKLRPSSVSSPAPAVPGIPVEAKPASAQTIKLTPKSAEQPAAASSPSETPTTTIPQGEIEDEKTVAMAKQTIRLVPKKSSQAPEAPKPSDPTVNLMQETATLKASDPTVKLTPASAASAIEEPQAETKPKLSIKKPQAQVQEMAQDESDDFQEEVSAAPTRDEPSMLFTIAAILAFLMVAYLSLMLFGQYSNQWNGGNMDVLGCHRIASK